LCERDICLQHMHIKEVEQLHLFQRAKKRS
jgi:hypothetical protein